jgi:hypothetical protein
VYFTVNPTGCGERKGFVEVRYDLYLEPGDHGYAEHYVQIPVWPDGGYPGNVNADGSPVREENYAGWHASLPRAWQNNPFCGHFVQMNPDVTDEEILVTGEEVLNMAYENWQDGDIRKNKNPPVNLMDTVFYRRIARPLYEKFREKRKKGEQLGDDEIAVHINTVLPALNAAAKNEIIQEANAAIERISACETRAELIVTTDYAKHKNSALYKVK